MKKIFYLFAIMAFSACESPLETLVPASSFQKVSTPTRSIQSFDPLSELYGIPVNIISYGNTNNKYLSAKPTGNDVCLYDQDDGSLRQRWYILNSNIYLAGGNDMTDYGKSYVTAYSTKPNSTPSPRLMTFMGRSQYMNAAPVSLNAINSTLYNIWNGGYYRTSPYYLQSSSQTGTTLKYTTSGNTDYAKWEIHPVGEYKILDITYIAEESDVIKRSDQSLNRAVLDNDKNEEIIYNFTVSGSYNESSSFSKAEGVSVSITEKMSIGIHLIEDKGSMGFEVSSTQTSSKDWSYSKSESKTRTIQHSVQIPVPGHTRTIVEAYMYSYDTSLTYIATLQDTNDNKTFRIKGRWTGITTNEFYCLTRNEKTNEIIGVYNFNSK